MSPSARGITLPRWVSALVGVAAVALGVVLILRPFTSLSVLALLIGIGALVAGVTEFVGAGAAPRPGLRILAGIGWCVAGLLVLGWPGITIGLLAVVVGSALIVTGAIDVVSGIRGSTDERLAAVIGGLAGIAFGVLALVWPDITVLVIAVVFGARMVLLGAGRIGAAFAGEPTTSTDASAPPVRRGRWRRWARVLGSAVALALAVILAVVSVRIIQTNPSVTDFYSAPDTVPTEPGVLLSSEPMTNGIPDNANAWRILYTTTRDDGQPAVASGLVMVGKDAPPGPRPVIAWAHGTTGTDITCAPSLLADPFASGAMFIQDQVLDRGWAMVAADYVGLGVDAPHPYLIGPPEGRSVLDAVRAARQLDVVELQDRTVVWGHSQGGHAALWTGALAPTYAPDVNVIGVAALAPASDLVGLVDNLSAVPGGSIFAAYVVDGYTKTYPDVQIDDYIRASARTLVTQAATRCLGKSALVSVIAGLPLDQPVFDREPGDGAFGQRLTQNIPRGLIPAPLFVGQGAADALVLPQVQLAYVQQQCAAGQHLQYRTYPGRDHVGVVAADSPLIPDLLTWTEDRLGGAPGTDDCPDL